MSMDLATEIRAIRTELAEQSKTLNATIKQATLTIATTLLVGEGFGGMEASSEAKNIWDAMGE